MNYQLKVIALNHSLSKFYKAQCNMHTTTYYTCIKMQYKQCALNLEWLNCCMEEMTMKIMFSLVSN